MTICRFRAAVAVWFSLWLAFPVSAEQAPKPFPDFEAKPVKPPQPGAGPRITVQIEPNADAPPAQAVATGEADGEIGSKLAICSYRPAGFRKEKVISRLGTVECFLLQC